MSFSAALRTPGGSASCTRSSSCGPCCASWRNRRLPDPRLVEPGCALYLGVKADLEEQRLASEMPGKVKVASLDKIDFLIANALRGVPLVYQRIPPASLPVKSSYLYFQLEAVGDAWETVRAAKNVAVYVPPDVPNPALELLGLRD